jgi:hypothetical protein
MNANDVKKVMRELLTKHWGEFDLPMPDVKLVNQARATYLARCIWRRGGTNTRIEVQRRATGDPKTLRRVLAHELVHHWEFLHLDQSKALALQQLGIRSPDEHGPEFMQQAERINAMEGADYVTEGSDESYDTSVVPPFYILVQPHRDTSNFGYTTAIRPSKKQKAAIAYKAASLQAKLFRITDSQFFAGSYPIGGYGGYGLPHGKDKQMALEELYNTGQQITL